jgi:hypothetical protein
MTNPPETAAVVLGAYKFSKIVPMLDNSPMTGGAAEGIQEYLLAKYLVMAQAEGFTKEEIAEALEGVNGAVARAREKISSRN